MYPFRNKFTPGMLSRLVFGLTLILFAKSSWALPPPPPMEELCKDSDVIVLGKFVGGAVSPPEDCKFWVTFQVKPEQFYKKPAGDRDIKLIQYRQQFHKATKECSVVPGPNAMPGEMEVSLKKPKDDKKLFFLKEKDAQFHDLTNLFYGIVNWDTAPKYWHKKFKETAICHGSAKK